MGTSPIFFPLVSVPLRGLDIRKRHLCQYHQSIKSRFSPLAGIRYSETRVSLFLRHRLRCFSPLAGIRYSETSAYCLGFFPNVVVSVPLRGLDIRKLQLATSLTNAQNNSFSPLAGIRYSETPPRPVGGDNHPKFQSPCGD